MCISSSTFMLRVYKSHWRGARRDTSCSPWKRDSNHIVSKKNRIYRLSSKFSSLSSLSSFIGNSEKLFRQTQYLLFKLYLLLWLFLWIFWKIDLEWRISIFSVERYVIATLDILYIFSLLLSSQRKEFHQKILSGNKSAIVWVATWNSANVEKLS